MSSNLTLSAILLVAPAHFAWDKQMLEFQPPGRHTVTPRIFTNDVRGLVEFLKIVFGATGEYRTGAPTEMKIGDSIVMVSGEGAREPMSAFLYVYVKDADATYQRAISAGAEPIEAPSDMPYGDRRAMVRDSWGNKWQIATHRRPDVTREADER